MTTHASPSELLIVNKRDLKFYFSMLDLKSVLKHDIYADHNMDSIGNFILDSVQTVQFFNIFMLHDIMLSS